MDTMVFAHAIRKMNDRGTPLRDLEILKSELADTISNYYVYLSLRDFLEKDEDFDVSPFVDKYRISFDSIDFLRNNYYKISNANETIRRLRDIKFASDEDFQLIQKMLLIFLGRDYDWKEVMSMREIFGARRALKKKNRSIMIHDLYRLLIEI